MDYKERKVEETILRKLNADVKAGSMYIENINSFYNDSLKKYINQRYAGAEFQDFNSRTSTYSISKEIKEVSSNLRKELVNKISKKK